MPYAGPSHPPTSGMWWWPWGLENHGRTIAIKSGFWQSSQWSQGLVTYFHQVWPMISNDTQTLLKQSNMLRPLLPPGAKYCSALASKVSNAPNSPCHNLHRNFVRVPSSTGNVATVAAPSLVIMSEISVIVKGQGSDHWREFWELEKSWEMLAKNDQKQQLPNHTLRFCCYESLLQANYA